MTVCALCGKEPARICQVIDGSATSICGPCADDWNRHVAPWERDPRKRDGDLR